MITFEFRQSARLQSFHFTADRTQGWSARDTGRMLAQFDANIAAGAFVHGAINWLDQKCVCLRTIVSESGRSTWRNAGTALIRRSKSLPPCSKILFGFDFIRPCDLLCKATGSGL
jgi:hypothetical protein